MSAVDAPPGISFAGRAAGEFASRPRSRRLAQLVFGYVALATVGTLMLVGRRLHTPMVEFLIVAPLVCVSVAGVGLAVRRARIRIDPDGIWWGWTIGGLRMHRNRIRRVRVYTDAVAFTPVRGSTWYLSRRDWDRFDRVAGALRSAALDYDDHARRAPLLARLQSYGLVLDGLLVVDGVIATMAFGFAMAL